MFDESISTLDPWVENGVRWFTEVRKLKVESRQIFAHPETRRRRGLELQRKFLPTPKEFVCCLCFFSLNEKFLWISTKEQGGAFSAHTSFLGKGFNLSLLTINDANRNVHPLLSFLSIFQI